MLGPYLIEVTCLSQFGDPLNSWEGFFVVEETHFYNVAAFTTCPCPIGPALTQTKQYKQLTFFVEEKDKKPLMASKAASKVWFRETDLTTT